ncbi:uncharacterized protein LOC127799883 isoform X2 [Diospyros lotus]|uniref:uncharacterized protein LOC127799883 isoform X2 n=1 Tax=Diospyros lotus TaxID=55363 RepID=UPI00224D08AB|nr:uncharacterized protein LOC127799883 isoform X2 [Diospyros lotus]
MHKTKTLLSVRSPLFFSNTILASNMEAAEKTRLDGARERLEMELMSMNQNPPTHISFGPVSDDDIFHWQGIIMGPSDTALEGSIFHLSIEFPTDYPYSPPQVKFETKVGSDLQVYHPNVSEDGTIRINILGEQWSPALTTEKLLLSICSILYEPILEDQSTSQSSF